MENIPETILSSEQQMRQEKAVELLKLVKSLYESNDSNDRYEFRISKNEFESKFNKNEDNLKKSLVLRDYLLGRVLFDLESQDYDQNSPLDKDGEIEKFIKDYYEAQQTK